MHLKTLPARAAGLSSENPPAVKPLTLQCRPVGTFQSADQLPPILEVPSGRCHLPHSLSIEQDRIVKVGGVRAHLQ